MNTNAETYKDNGYLKKIHTYINKNICIEIKRQKMRDSKSICSLNNNQINQWATIDTLTSWKAN